MCNVLDIAKYVVYKHWKDGVPITNLRLQKLLYYIQGYALRKCNEVAYSESIYRWPYGPVVTEVYFEYNIFRAKAISQPDDEEINGIVKRLKKDQAIFSVINYVVEKAYSFTAAQLVEKTHQETPWKSTNDSEIISCSVIAMYFSNHSPLECEGIAS